MKRNLYLKSTPLKTYYLNIIGILEKFFLPVMLVLIRLQMARVFWYSGLTKISDWQSTIYLFENEYKVPLVSPELAAYLSVTTELSTPALLVLGFMTRLAASQCL